MLCPNLNASRSNGRARSGRELCELSLEGTELDPRVPLCAPRRSFAVFHLPLIAGIEYEGLMAQNEVKRRERHRNVSAINLDRDVQRIDFES